MSRQYTRRGEKRKKVRNILKGMGSLSRRRYSHEKLDKELDATLKAEGQHFRGFNPSKRKKP